MKLFDSKYTRISTLATFFLIPLSGLVTDVYIPSFPEMQDALHTGPGGIQLTLSLFLVSYGFSMLVAGSLVDSYGRYRIVLGALLLFALSNFMIALIPNIWFLYLMRIFQGMLSALIVVGKRAFLVDIYTGDKLKHYMSLLSVVWALGPITAPFLGGYLQSYWGWTANFYFLGFYALFSLLIEWRFCGEAVNHFHPFRFAHVKHAYAKILGTKDFMLGLFVLGTSYAMVLIFSMTAPFIIEDHFHFTSITTGYCALISGLGIFSGGMLAKTLTAKSFLLKLRWANVIQILWGVLMFVLGRFYSNIYLLMCFVFCMHVCAGFIYNVYFTYCLIRFPQNAGLSSGLTSGGSYLVTSVLSAALVQVIHITDQAALAVGYISLALLIFLLLLLLGRIGVISNELLGKV